MPRLSPAEERRRIRLYRAGLTDGEIAREVGVTVSAVGYWRRSRGLPPNRPRGRRGGRLSPEEERIRMVLYKRGLSDYAIGKILGRSRTCIRAWRLKKGLPPNRRPSRLTPEEEARRRELYEFGYTDSEIAKELGTTVGAIAQWRRRRGLPPNKSAHGVLARWEERAINLYHRHRDWSWERLAFEVFKPARVKREIRGEFDYDDAIVESYVFGGKRFELVRRIDRRRDGSWRIEERYEVPERYVQRLRYAVGQHLMRACRADPSCPLKPLLPEWEEEVDERGEDNV